MRDTDALSNLVRSALTRRQVLKRAAGGLALAPLGRFRALSARAADAPVVRCAWWTDVGRPTPFQISSLGPGGPALLTLLYDTLTWKDESGVMPWLASAWRVEDDGASYVFTLVDNAVWHDGLPVTAEDVAFSFDYYARHPFAWAATEAIEAVEAVSAGEVAVRLARPWAPFLEAVAGGAPILPRHIWDGVEDPTRDERPEALIGGGPFRLAEYDASAGSYRLLANERYWRGQPRAGEWRQIMLSTETQFEAFRQGEIDLTMSTDASVQSLLADDARARVFATAPLSMVRLIFNLDRPPLDRREVRQALAHALDRAMIAETMTRGPAIVGSAGVTPPETYWSHPNPRHYAFDPEQARELLGEAALELDLIADASAREPDLMGPMLEAAGITLNVRRVDAATRAQLIADGDFQMVLTGHIGGGGDPDYLRTWFLGGEANAFARGPVFQQEEYARLADEQVGELDQERRRALIWRMQEILADELPTLALYHRRFYWVHDPAVFTPMATWNGLLNGIPFPTNKLALFGG